MHHAPTASTTTGDHRGRVRRCVARVALVLLAAAALYQGLWAQLAPRSFYDDFPGGMSWLAGEGAYNEHFVRDIGGLANGLGVVAALTAWWLSRELVIANAAGWLTYALPHLAFHLAHPLDGAAMQVPNVVVLCSEVVLPLLGLLAICSSGGSRPSAGAEPQHTHPMKAR